MKKLSKSLKWLDGNILGILVGIYIFFIPLYPKLPLHMINYTYIAFRLEDVYAALMFAVFSIQFLRKKVTLNRRYIILFSLFWGAVFLSTLWGLYIAKNIVISHLGYLNALRRVEYMFVFFVAISVIKSKKDFFRYMGLVLLAFLLVNIYGLGQKFLGWPAVQTMNPEYAKGYLLFLTPDARISSTFAGHYDLAGYLVLLLPIVWAFYFARKKIYYIILFILGVLILIFTASRISYGAYIVSTFPFLFIFRKFKPLAIALVFTLLFTFTSNSLTSRFQRTFQVKQIFVDQKTGNVVVPQKLSAKTLPAGSFYIPLQKQGGAVSTNEEDLLRQRLLDQVHEQEKSTGQKLNNSQEQQMIASLSANLKPVNTVVSDISFATRLQVEWPRAINAFLTNPVLGTGPSSITEATDNDYLRSVGEVGLLGTALFALILFSLTKDMLQFANKQKTNDKYIYYGFLFGLGGLLINATYIDVFEASKIAFQFWLIAGLLIGSILYEKRSA